MVVLTGADVKCLVGRVSRIKGQGTDGERELTIRERRPGCAIVDALPDAAVRETGIEDARSWAGYQRGDAPPTRPKR
jgi:hypothetical protein